MSTKFGEDMSRTEIDNEIKSMIEQNTVDGAGAAVDEVS